jgi:hypothetical protein
MPTEVSKASSDAGPKLTKIQQTMFSILWYAKCLTTDEWLERARGAGLGTKRKADLFDARTALKHKGLVFETAGGGGE